MGATVEAGYTAAWQRLSVQLRAQQPWCSWCFAVSGEVFVDAKGEAQTVRLTVDHIDSDTSHNEPSNLRVLCDRCHGTRTGDGWRA